MLFFFAIIFKVWLTVPNFRKMIPHDSITVYFCGHIGTFLTKYILRLSKAVHWHWRHTTLLVVSVVESMLINVLKKKYWHDCNCVFVMVFTFTQKLFWKTILVYFVTISMWNTNIRPEYCSVIFQHHHLHPERVLVQRKQKASYLFLSADFTPQSGGRKVYAGVRWPQSHSTILMQSLRRAQQQGGGGVKVTLRTKCDYLES